eukprot:m.32224 g.32224  ORF g.32224 m.32224 type:complete len:523 (-) comp8387_c0_seq2:73-1641(-)
MFTFVFVTLFVGRFVAATDGATKPHIFMVLIDDLGYNNVGFHNPDQISPNINKLVSDGIRLEAHYTFRFCSPTRSSFLSGRFPLHVNQEQPGFGAPGGVDLRMATIANQLKKANYKTHFVGKGHIGSYARANLPINRGFDSHFGFLGGGEDHFTQSVGNAKDLWRDNSPAYNETGVYSCDLYGSEILKIVNNHDPSDPLFMYIPFHDTHAPYEAPAKWLDPRVKQPLRQLLQAMLTCTDDAVGKLVQLLTKKGMWENSLLVWSADNGGPQYWGCNNYPLRGGKGSDFQGGVRTAAFVSGGILPTSVRGSVLEHPVHVCDWYATFCSLAGVDPNDGQGDGVPPIDSIDFWPLLSGANTTAPRTDVLLSSYSIISGNWKYINSTFRDNWDKECNHNATDPNCLLGYWTGPVWPVANCGGGGGPETCPHQCNKQSNCTQDLHECGDTGCLFNLSDDPQEKHNMASVNKEMLAMMQSKLREVSKGIFQTTDSDMTFSNCRSDVTSNIKYFNGFEGPMCDSSAPKHK